MISWLSFGCHNLTGGSSLRRSERMIKAALDLGITRFDVAPAYGLGTAERTLGRSLGVRRNDPKIEITTKYGILPDRYGRLKALFREPYRLVRSFRRPSALKARAAGMHDLPHSQFPLSAREAAERSLKALGVDRLSVFLSHELLPERQSEDFASSMQELKRDGLIERAGCSGSIDNVTLMLAFAGREADVSQVPLTQFNSLPPSIERRGFNVANAARTFLAAGSTKIAREALFDVIPTVGVTGALAPAMAGVLAISHRCFPNAIFLVNASTPERLAEVALPLANGALDEWAEAHAEEVSRAIF